jgi:voltage-gated potassium channel
MSQKIKKRIFEILEIASTYDLASRTFDIFIITLISLNTLAVILETVKSLFFQFANFFRTFEIFSVSVFTIEYLLRLWTCTSDSRFRRPFKGRIKFVITPLALVDLMAILPFYLPMIIPLDLRFIRAVRLFRIFRLFKMGRYSKSLKTFGDVLKEKKEELIITMFVVSILLIIASSLMYFVENEAQPEAFSSIPEAMWWGVATLTTVGYGDVYPVTPLGKFLGAIIAILGIGMFALPAGILGSGFVGQIQRRRKKRIICPHCGRDIDKPPETTSPKH